MTHDPWQLQPSLSCPSCHVAGKVVSQENTDDEWPCGDDYCCVDCGSTWFDGGALSDVALKEWRVAYGRLIEGRPYEPPAPQFEPIKTTPAWAEAMDKLLRHYYDPASIASTMGMPALLLTGQNLKFESKWTSFGDWIDRAKELGNWGDDGDPTE